MADREQTHEREHTYERGKMDITENQKTFAAFVWFWIWHAIAVAFVLIFLALFNS